MQRCKVCVHADRGAIDLGLVRGESTRIIASRYGLTQACVFRHSQHAKSVATSKAKIEAHHERTVLEKVRGLIATVEKALSAQDADALDGSKPVELVREVGRLLELEAKLTGALAPRKVEVTRKDLSRDDQIAELRKLETEIAEERARLEQEGLAN